MNGPRCGKDVHAVKALCAVHLRQHLVHDPVSYPCAIVPSASVAIPQLPCQIVFMRGAVDNLTSWERSSRTRRRRARTASRRSLVRIGRAPIAWRA